MPSIVHNAPEKTEHDPLPPTSSRAGNNGAASRLGILLILSLALVPLAAGAAQQAARVAVGDEAIDFTMQSIDGETYSLADLSGEKTALVIFFRGTW